MRIVEILTEFHYKISCTAPANALFRSNIRVQEALQE